MTVFAESTVSVTAVTHAANILAEWLDNNEDGVVDNAGVVSNMVSSKAALVLFGTQMSTDAFFEADCHGGYQLQDLNQAEMAFGGVNAGARDASIEEVLHLVHVFGFGLQFSDLAPYTSTSRTLLTDAMDVARGGQYFSIPNPYPSGAWYTYNGRNCANLLLSFLQPRQTLHLMYILITHKQIYMYIFKYISSFIFALLTRTLI